MTTDGKPVSERTTQHLNLATGEVTEQRHNVPPASLPERFEGMIASAREQMADPILDSVLAVRCDGCGRTVEVKRPELPAGWSTNDRGEFCPDCTRPNRPLTAA